MSRTLIQEGLIALREIAQGPTASRPTIEPEPFKFDFLKKGLKPAGQRRLTPVPFFDTGDTSSARPGGRTDRDRKSRLLKAPPLGLKKYPRSLGQEYNIARPPKLDNDGKLLRKGTPGLDLKQRLGGDISGTYFIPNYGKGPGLGKRALSEQEFIKNLLKPQSSGDFLANYVTSGQAGKNVFVGKPSDDLSKMNPFERIKYIRKAQKFSNSPFLDNPIPGRRAPGSAGSPVDDPTGQFGRPGLPGGQTAQSVNDLTFGDLVHDMKDPKNNYRPTVGRENIERRKQDLVDLYGPDVDKGSRRVSAEIEELDREYQSAKRKSTLSQNNIYPQDTRTPIKKAGDKLKRFFGTGGNEYDSPSQKDPTTIRYREF